MPLPPPPPGLPPPPRKKVPPPGQPGEVILLDSVAPTVTATTSAPAPPPPVTVVTPAPIPTPVQPQPQPQPQPPQPQTQNKPVTTTTTTTATASATKPPTSSPSAATTTTKPSPSVATGSSIVKNSPFGPTIGSSSASNGAAKPGTTTTTTTTTNGATKNTAVAKPSSPSGVVIPANTKPVVVSEPQAPTIVTQPTSSVVTVEVSVPSLVPVNSSTNNNNLQSDEKTDRATICGDERDAILWLFVAWQSQQQRAADRNRTHEAKRHNVELLETEARSQVATQEAVASSSLFATILAVASITAPFLSKLSSIQQQHNQTALMLAQQQQQQQKSTNSSASSSSSKSKNSKSKQESEHQGELSVEFRSFLNQVQLEDHAHLFAEHGFDDVDSLLSITAEDLIEMDCFNVGERRKILTRLSSSSSPRTTESDTSPVRTVVNATAVADSQQMQQQMQQQQQQPNYHITSKSLQTFVSPSVSSSSSASSATAGDDVFQQIVCVLREDDQLLQRDWTNLRCRPPYPHQAVPTLPAASAADLEDQRWEARWKAACRADLLTEAQWEREARNVIQRINSTGTGGIRGGAASPSRNYNVNYILSSLPRAPIAHRAENGGLVLLSDSSHQHHQQQQQSGSVPFLPQRQKLIQRRWLGLPCP